MPLKPRNVIDEDDPRVAQIGHPAPPWMVNYADLMTELVCFFVILYALGAALNQNMVKAKKEVENLIKDEQLEGQVKITKDGMQITLQEKGQKVFFASGQADLSPQMTGILNKFTPTLKKLSKDHEIIVEGHTDNVPTTKFFQTNWELSTARATNVVHYLIRSAGFDPRGLSAVGYGENRPIVPNDTAENREQNRRVVFFVKNNPPPTSPPVASE